METVINLSSGRVTALTNLSNECALQDGGHQGVIWSSAIYGEEVCFRNEMAFGLSVAD